VDADLDALETALYVRADDLLKAFPERAPGSPAVGIAPWTSDAELVALAVMQALLGHQPRARWMRFVVDHLSHLFPFLVPCLNSARCRSTAEPHAARWYSLMSPPSTGRFWTAPQVVDWMISTSPCLLAASCTRSGT
jgi:hypothetical protein